MTHLPNLPSVKNPLKMATARTPERRPDYQPTQPNGNPIIWAPRPNRENNIQARFGRCLNYGQPENETSSDFDSSFELFNLDEFEYSNESEFTSGIFDRHDMSGVPNFGNVSPIPF